MPSQDVAIILNLFIQENRNKYMLLQDSWHKEVVVPAHEIVKRGRKITGAPAKGVYDGEWKLGSVEIRKKRKEWYIYVYVEVYDFPSATWIEPHQHPTIRFPARWLNDPDAAMEELRVWTAERAKRREEKARLKREEEEQRKQNEHREFIKREAQRLGVI